MCITHTTLNSAVGTLINFLKQNIMKYFNLLQNQEKDFIIALQKELDFTLQNEFRTDFTTIKSVLKDKFGPLKDSENIQELGIILAQIKKVKELQTYLQEIENQITIERDAYVQDIEKEFVNW